MNITYHHLTGKLRHFSYAVIAMWAFALFSHTAHGETLSQLDSDVVCHLCQNSLDNNPEVNLETVHLQRIIRAHVLADTPATPKPAKFILPNLRAPPY